MGIYFGVDIYGFKYYKKNNEKDKPEYEIKFDKSERGNVEYVKKMIKDLDDENYVFYIYKEYSVSFEPISSPGFMWSSVTKEYIMSL